MASKVGSLFVSLGINAAEFAGGLGKAEKRLAKFARFSKLAAAAAGAAIGTALVAFTRHGLRAVDSQAKLAQSLGTTVKSMQILNRAGDLAGVGMATIEQATIALTRRLSQAAGGMGPAVDALDRLGLSAEELGEMDLDVRIASIQDAIAKFIPEAEQAAVASALFGDRAGVMFARIDAETLRIAAKDIEDFGVAVSEVDADQIERTNDALSRLGLIGQGVSTQMAAAFAPSLESLANGLAAVWRVAVGPLKAGIQNLGENLGRLATYAATAAAWFGGKLVAAMAIAALGTVSLSGALVFLRGALIRTGFGALIVAAGELVYQFTKLVGKAGGFGEAMSLMKDVAIEVWQRIKDGGNSLSEGLGYTFQTIKAGWFGLLAEMQQKWADFLHITANSIRDVPGMEDAWLSLGNAAIMAGSKYYEFSTAAGDATVAAGAHAVASAAAAEAMRAPLESLAALRDVMRDNTTETYDGAAAADAYNAALADLGETAGGGGGGGGVAGALDALAQKAKSVFDATRTPAENLVTKLAELRQMLSLGLIDWDTFGRAAQKAAQDAGAAMQPLIEGIRDSLSSSIGSAINGLVEGTKTLKEGLADVFKQLMQMALNRLIQQFLTSMFGGFGGIKIPGFASGTNNAPGGVALVGERGPELVNLPKGSQVVPNHEIGGAAPSIFNIFDPSIVGDYLSGPQGEKAIINIVQRNRRALGA